MGVTWKGAAARKVAFLKHLASSGSVQAAAREAAIDRSHLYKLRRRDGAFAMAWDEALEAKTNVALALSLRLRSIDMPMRRSSDRLLALLLRAQHGHLFARNLIRWPN